MTDGHVRHAPWLVTLTTAFVVALAALLAPAGTADVEAPARVAVHLPTPVIAAVILTLMIVECVGLGYVLLAGRRRKRKGDDEFELYYEQPHVSPWIAPLLLAPTLLLVAGLVYLVRHGAPALEQWWTNGTVMGPGLPGPPPAPPSGPERPFVSIPLLTWSITAIGVVIAAGGLALLLWFFLAHRFGRPQPGATETAPLLVEAVDESLDDLRRERNARIAIVKCYRRFEQAMARARVPRQPWETPVEYMHAALSRLALPARAVQGLTDLFEIARFSHHPVGVAEHEAAWTCLTEIRDALARRADAVPAS